MFEEQGHIRIDGETSRGLPLLRHFKPVRTCVLLLVESHVPDLHQTSLRSGQARRAAGISNKHHTVDSVALKARLPTKMFLKKTLSFVRD
jgi:hypothetical protein